MRRIVLTYGLIAGAIMSAMLLITIPFQMDSGFENGMVIGYASMVLAFMLIFFGVRSYRDNVAGGTIGFGRAFGVGALIALVGSLCYVATWEVMFTRIGPEFIAKYEAHTMEQERARGATPAELAAKQVEMDEFRTMYNNPLYNAAFTFLEPLPPALILSLVTAGVLSRRRKERLEPPVGVRA